MIKDAMTSNVSMAMRSFIQIIAAIVIMFTIEWRLTLVTVAGTFILALSIKCYYTKLRKLTSDQSSARARMSSVATEVFGNIRTVKAFANEEHEQVKFELDNIHTAQLGYKKAGLTAVYQFYS